MLKSLHLSSLGLLLSSALFATPMWGQLQEAPDAPIPAQIMAAKKIFIANGGERSSPQVRENSKYSGGPKRAYNHFYNAVESWRPFELVSAPADADLVCEIQFDAASSRGGMRIPIGEFTLRLLDPRTHTTLWVMTSYMEMAGMSKNREKDYARAFTELVDDFKKLVSPQTTGPQK
jgi:hypothetical protein